MTNNRTRHRSFKPFKKGGKFSKSAEGPKPKGIKAQRDMNLKAIMASLLNYPDIFSAIENDLLNIDVLSKQIVNMHSGTISVLSIPNQGSTFTVFLPLK